MAAFESFKQFTDVMNKGVEEDAARRQFLSESWSKAGTYGEGYLTEEERIRYGVKTSEEIDPQVRSYVQMKTMMEHLPESIGAQEKEILEILFDGVVDAVERYVGSVLDYNYIRKNAQDRVDLENLQSVDESRRYTHNALIQSIEALKRRFIHNGLDISWVNVIGLSDRVRVKEWAQAVVQYLGNKNLVEGDIS